MASTTRGGRAKAAGTKRRKMQKAIEDTVSEALSDPDERGFFERAKDALTNRAVRAQDAMSHYRAVGEIPDEYRKAKDPGKIRKDPKPPRKMGGEKFFQHPFKRRVSNALGTTELPVGDQVPNRMRPAGSRYKSGNLTSRFGEGGRAGDVRDNTNRGKTY